MQEKKYPLQEWLFAVVMWAVFSFVLLWLHYKVYGKMLLAGDRIAFWGIVILTPAYPLGRWLSQSSLSPEPPDRNSIAVRLYTLFWCLIPVCCFYTLLTEPYRLAVWLLGAWLVLFVLLHRHRQDTRPAAVGLLFLTGLLVTGAYLLAVQPVSAAQAEDMVGQAGYTNLYPFDANEFSKHRLVRVRAGQWRDHRLHNAAAGRPARLLRLPRRTGRRPILRHCIGRARPDRSGTTAAV